MLDRLAGYTDDELDQIADENENWDPAGSGDTLDQASAGMRVFVADFEQCTAEGGAPAESTSPGASTETSSAATESTTHSATTEPE
jgi:hypothetical protein